MAGPNIRGSLVPRPEQPGPGKRAPRVQGLCDLHVCEPLIATLFALVLLLTYSPALPAPFGPALPPAGATNARRAPTRALAAGVTPTPTVRAAIAVGVTPSAVQPVATSTLEVGPTPTPSPRSDAFSPLATPTPTSDASAGPSPTGTPSLTPAEEPTHTPAAASTRTATVGPTSTSAEEPTLTPESPGWDLARNLIGLWEHTDEDRAYSFDFLAEGLVFVAGNGARAYAIEGDRTIVIQMPGDAWIITVRDLSGDTLILEGVFGASDEFRRLSGISNLQEAVVGLWTDPDDEDYPLEFTPGGIALGEFGRGTYRAASPHHLFVDCDDPAACSPYRDYAQAEDAPLSLRVYEISGDLLTVLGFRASERWTLERFEGHPTLGADIVGVWEDEYGFNVEFTAAGDLIRDDGSAGSYQVLSETTLWVTLDGAGEAWVVTELDADTMAYIEFDFFWDEPWGYTRVE
jgi:hypothetical protein